jgi:transcriptional regulator with XRE-family HTH domain
MDIGDKIRKVRELKGYKQEYVAEKVGLSVTAYGNIERNASGLTFERLEEIATALEVTVQDILNIPEQLNIHTIATAHQVGFNHIYNDQRPASEIDNAPTKQTFNHLEKEIEYLRGQNSKLLSLLENK